MNHITDNDLKEYGLTRYDLKNLPAFPNNDFTKEKALQLLKHIKEAPHVERPRHGNSR